MIVLRWIDGLNIAIGRSVSFLIWVGIVVLCYEVVARYIFGQPTIWAHGYTQRIFGSYFVLVGAYTLIKKNHVRVDLLLKSGPPRWQAFLDLLNFSFLILWGAVLTYEAFWFFEDSWRFNEVDDSALRHPMWPVKFAMFAGVALITLQGIAEAIRAIVRIINPSIEIPSEETKESIL